MIKHKKAESHIPPIAAVAVGMWHIVVAAAVVELVDWPEDCRTSPIESDCLGRPDDESLP